MPHIPDSRHADHDPLAIAAHAAGDATGTELETARDLLAGCADCAALHADLRAISAALPTVPAPVRPRDFRLTQEQAASLRPAGWRRLLAPLAGPRFAFAGPLGGGLATLGIAGILVAGSLGAPIAGSAPAAGGEDAARASAPIEGTGPVDAPSVDPLIFKNGAAESPLPGATDELGVLTGPAGTPAPSGALVPELAAPASPGTSVTAQDTTAIERQASSGDAMPLLLLGSVALVGIGLLLAGLRIAGRRLAAGR